MLPIRSRRTRKRSWKARVIHRRQRRRHRIACRRRAPADESDRTKWRPISRTRDFPLLRRNRWKENKHSLSYISASPMKSHGCNSWHINKWMSFILRARGISTVQSAPPAQRRSGRQFNCGLPSDWQDRNIPRRRRWSLDVGQFGGGGGRPPEPRDHRLQRHWPLVFQINGDWPSFLLNDICIDSHPLWPSDIDNRLCLQVVFY